MQAFAPLQSPQPEAEGVVVVAVVLEPSHLQGLLAAHGHWPCCNNAHVAPHFSSVAPIESPSTATATQLEGTAVGAGVAAGRVVVEVKAGGTVVVDGAAVEGGAVVVAPPEA
eukprot:TRINITY_DN10110_c0_g1_i3.p2 TRINITY_DN10110_c0_g1~~TRINITY_DN10110_c0_g1_i3.p2  ORF type:complete len:112 (-),score=19.16 TRINITY_DN10110_c0_g1_i3:58-393(-)